jgi:2-aminophenol/2-amino-5-chlorophenol 1,6-dioxygenase alpha subunit
VSVAEPPTVAGPPVAAGSTAPAGPDQRAAFAGAALIPGMPQLLGRDQAPSWQQLSDATRRVGTALRAAGADTLIVLSTQWFTVLGHQLQLEPRLTGRRVDENWYAYDYGTLDYELSIDTELTERWASELEGEGLQARRTRYEGFPIDTGTIVAHTLLDPDGALPMALVSCNLYAGAQDIATLGATALRAAVACGRRPALVAVSGLSSALTQRWIEPREDAVGSAEYERWDRRILELLAAGRLSEALALREEYARAAQADSQLRALAFLAGTGCLEGAADVSAYGPIWGTGAAVVHWSASEPSTTRRDSA